MATCGPQLTETGQNWCCNLGYVGSCITAQKTCLAANPHRVAPLLGVNTPIGSLNSKCLYRLPNTQGPNGRGVSPRRRGTMGVRFCQVTSIRSLCQGMTTAPRATWHQKHADVFMLSMLGSMIGLSCLFFKSRGAPHPYLQRRISLFFIEIQVLHSRPHLLVDTFSNIAPAWRHSQHHSSRD